MKQIKSKQRVANFGEVYTNEREVNAMLDLVKEESYRMSSLFLEPACGNGNFLVEILKRKLSACQTKEDVKQSLSSIYAIDILDDNVLESKKRLYDLVKEYLTEEEAFFIMDQTIVCGDGLELLETDFYKQMKFDVIIGNPPYQLNLGNNSGNSSKSKAIYHKFIDVAKSLNPKYITMIIPSRWMTKNADGVPDAWVDMMISENKIKVMHDFLDAEDCFPNVSIRGGVCYFLWDNFFDGKCDYYLHEKGSQSTSVSKQSRYLNGENLGVVIRDYLGLSILEKVKNVEGDYFSDPSSNFSSFVSPKDFFTNKIFLTSSWKGYSLEMSDTNSVKCYLNKKSHQTDYGFVNETDIPKNKHCIHLHKVYIPAAGDPGERVLGYPFYGEPNSVCSQTYLIIGYSQNLTKDECYNIISYIQTKFFRYLVSLKKKTQNAPRKVYELVPIQDFSKPWTDSELYEKYGLTTEEIEYIESMIRPMK